MAVNVDFLTHLKDLLSGLGQVSTRRMFGGAALYCDGYVFAFLISDAVYLKTDEPGRRAFTDEGMGPFTFKSKSGKSKSGKTIAAHAYYRAPERLLDDPDEMHAWAARAVAVSRRDAATKAKTSTRKPKARGAVPKPKPKRAHRA